MSDTLKTWPERIWLQHSDEGTDPVPDFGQCHDATWCHDHINDNDIEYVRADKVCEWLHELSGENLCIHEQIFAVFPDLRDQRIEHVIAHLCQLLKDKGHV